MAWSAMSDSEDSDILDEIKDLESILATTPANPKSPQKFSLETIHEPFEVDIISENSNDPEDSSLDHVTAAFDLNKRLIEELINAKNEVTVILEECNKRLQIIERKIKQHGKNWIENPKMAISTAGMPYFKDKDYFGAPRNDDVKLKIARGELQIVNFHKGRAWSIKDRATLLNAIYQEVTTFVIDSSQKKEKEKTALYQNMFNKILSGRNLEEVVCMLGEKKFDWLKIAAMHFDDKHSADECSVMWNILLHPNINKKKWSHTEELKLQKITEIYGCQDWDNIAKKLDTKRSGYQCLIKYNCTDHLSKLIDRAWTIKEDEKLCNIISKCKIGDFIPWNEVLSYMNLRSKSQIYFRWMFKLAPHLKKGRFTKTESETLLQHIDKFGTDFNLIATLLMPHRTAIQLNDHYQTLMSRESIRHWTLSSDMKLIDLYKQLGPDWSKIAREFKYKNRTQVRHRYTSLYKYALKGLSMFEIPRQKNENSVNSNDTESSCEEYNVEEIDNDTDDKIDQLLIEHFQNLNTNQFFHQENVYDPEELSKDTKELYFILESLGANLDIPDNFTYLPLMGRDKQLLLSLKTYMKSMFERQNSIDIKIIRLQMFGPEDNEGEKTHFIPPLPFKVYPNLKNNKHNDNIDYALDINKKFLVDIETEFNTPESIISFIGGVDKDIQFNKISNLRCIRRDKCTKQTIINSVNPCHISDPRKKISPFLSSSMVNKSNNQSINSSLKPNQLKHQIEKSNHLNQRKPITVYEPIGEIHGTYMDHKKDLLNVSNTIIKPDYITLLCYRNLVTLNNIYNIENQIFGGSEEHQGVEKIHKSEKAYELLKKRLIHLFRYPICMSHLSLQEINGTMEIFSMESKNIACKKRKIAQKGMFQRKKIRTNPLETFIHESNLNMQLLDKSKKS